MWEPISFSLGDACGKGQRADASCLLSQAGQEATFHVDHVVPVKVGGVTEAENLALACVSCSLRKAARQQVVDPQTGQEVVLFNPRKNEWHWHFRLEGVHLLGITQCGRATVAALAMNRPLALSLRTKPIDREEQILLSRSQAPPVEAWREARLRDLQRRMVRILPYDDSTTELTRPGPIHSWVIYLTQEGRRA